MKFARILLLAIIYVISLVSSKKKVHQDSQGTRNYRHPHSDPSMNPLPNNWHTGPRHDFAVHNYKKYREQSSKLAHSHGYQDTTKVMADRAKHLH